MAGVDKDFLGTARLTPGFTVGYVPQEPRLDETTDVRGNIEEAVAATRALLTAAGGTRQQDGRGRRPTRWTSCMDEMGRVQDAIDAANAWDLDRQLEIAMDAMRLPPGDAKPTTLSGGERRRVALCKALLQKPDLLLLDEPTNHLDAESVAWLERHLQEYPGTVVAVTHDRYFLDNVAQWILELDRGQRHPVEGQLLRPGWSRSRAGWPRRRSRSRPGARRWPASWNGRRWRREPASPRARPASAPTRSWPARNTRSARTSWCCRFRRGRTWATSSCGPRTSARATATTC